MAIERKAGLRKTPGEGSSASVWVAKLQMVTSGCLYERLSVQQARVARCGRLDVQ